MLDDRAKLLMKALVERYIADGQPVGSRTLSRASGLELSPATIRNVMSDLEEMGLIVSPHTSAGRIPTARGYRLFVDTMLTAQRKGTFTRRTRLAPDQPQKVIANAAQICCPACRSSSAWCMAPRRSSVFRHIEFLRLSERRCWSSSCRPMAMCRTASSSPRLDYSQSQLVEAANFLNATTRAWPSSRCASACSTEVESLRSAKSPP
jgi:heat-inducible transcriptional repressor